MDWEPARAVRGRMPGRQDEYGFELKWDGFRMLLLVKDGNVRLVSRGNKDKTAQFPEFKAIGKASSGSFVLDGEAIALDADGRQDIGLVGSRWHTKRPGEIQAAAQNNPALYVAFDLLEQDGNDLRALPYSERRRRLEALGFKGNVWLTTPATTGEGDAMLLVAKERGFEGIVAKRLTSRYRGGPTGDWVKVLLHDRQEFVVGGWNAGESNRPGVLHTLLLGYYDQPGSTPLRYAGHVSNFDAGTTEKLVRLARELASTASPFDEVPADDEPWFPMRPELVVEVRFNGLGPDGRLRHPSFLGFRDDKPAREVVWEQLYPAPR